MSTSEMQPGTAEYVEGRRGVLRTSYVATLFIFILVTLFDPMDALLGMKIPLYGLCWAAGILYSLSIPGGIRVRTGLLLYALLMVVIPLTSIALYEVTNGAPPFEGFPMFKAYAFISLALLLYVTRIQLLPHLCAALTVLAIAILVLGTVVLVEPSLFLPIFAFGDRSGMFSLNERDYGYGLVMFQMYFVTSSMLALSASYYLDRAVRNVARRRTNVVLCLVSLAGMVLAGSRNNLLAAILLPILILFVHSKRKVLAGAMIGMGGVLGITMVWNQISILLDPSEPSNSTKLQTLSDYGSIFDEPLTLLIGQGLGAYQHWTGRGFFYVTELTYLEVVRNFGIVLGGVMLLLLAFPVLYGFLLRPSYSEKSVIIGYLAYLGMSASNPLLFSSMGMLILSVIMSNIALHQSAEETRYGFPELAPRGTV